jgi:hypothetical protein
MPTAVTDKFWSMLLDKIEEQRVVPVIGPALVQVPSGGKLLPLETVIARQLADRFDIEAQDKDGAVSLHDVVARAHRLDPREDFHGEVHRILKGLGPLPVPEPLLALARIAPLRLYLSLTFDSLMVQALDQERHLADPERQHLRYAPNQCDIDLPQPLKQLDEPLVYALFGKSCTAPEFVINDEDRLEWVAALQNTDHRPRHIFDVLQRQHLLFLGCAMPDWLQRFFLRMTRQGRISSTPARESLVDASLPDHTRLVAFLDHFSPKTAVLETDPAAFVLELETRWRQHQQAQVLTTPPDLPADLRAGGVFLSYAGEDVQAAARLHDALATRQVDCWFDARRLASGDIYEKVIERNLGLCGVVLVMLSEATVRRLQRWRDEDGNHPDKKPYFLKEWELALARERLFGDSLTLCPVRIDQTDLRHPLIPEGLRTRTYADLLGGNADDSFVDRIKKAVREQRKKTGGQR